MTSQKRRQWARVFISARNQGMTRGSILLFSLQCVRQVGSVAPFLVALRVMPRSPPSGGGGLRIPLRMPPVWVPRVVGLLAVLIAFWGLFAPHATLGRVDLSQVGSVREDVPIDWLTRDGGIVSVPMPSKRLERQKAPPCNAPPSGQEEINGGCWAEMVVKPPCEQFYEHAGKCYVPLRETPRPPTSVDP